MADDPKEMTDSRDSYTDALKSIGVLTVDMYSLEREFAVLREAAGAMGNYGLRDAFKGFAEKMQMMQKKITESLQKANDSYSSLYTYARKGEGKDDRVNQERSAQGSEVTVGGPRGDVPHES